MLTQEMSVTIRILHKQGNSIKGIARELGISKNTVKKYLVKGDKPSYRTRPTRPSKLDPFKPYLQQRIRDAAPDWIPASVLFDEILELGYTGKVRILSAYLQPFKKKVKQDPLVRFETPPGHQMQVDFTTIRRKGKTLKAFVATLGYSRACYVRFFDHERSEAWIDGLKGAFEFFGGTPKEVLFDNAKAIVIERDVYGKGKHRWNNALLELAEEYGFQPRACRPYRAKTKGKVERFNHYLKNSFVTPLIATLNQVGLELDVEIANAKVGKWLIEKANARIHATTKEVPNHRLIEEQRVFLPLPKTHKREVEAHINLPSAIPFESVQHPLSTYDQLLGGAL